MRRGPALSGHPAPARTAAPLRLPAAQPDDRRRRKRADGAVRRAVWETAEEGAWPEARRAVALRGQHRRRPASHGLDPQIALGQHRRVERPPVDGDAEAVAVHVLHAVDEGVAGGRHDVGERPRRRPDPEMRGALGQGYGGDPDAGMGPVGIEHCGRAALGALARGHDVARGDALRQIARRDRLAVADGPPSSRSPGRSRAGCPSWHSSFRGMARGTGAGSCPLGGGQAAMSMRSPQGSRFQSSGGRE